MVAHNPLQIQILNLSRIKIFNHPHIESLDKIDCLIVFPRRIISWILLQHIINVKSSERAPLKPKLNQSDSHYFPKNVHPNQLRYLHSCLRVLSCRWPFLSPPNPRLNGRIQILLILKITTVRHVGLLLLLRDSTLALTALPPIHWYPSTLALTVSLLTHYHPPTPRPM